MPRTQPKQQPFAQRGPVWPASAAAVLLTMLKRTTLGNVRSLKISGASASGRRKRRVKSS